MFQKKIKNMMLTNRNVPFVWAFFLIFVVAALFATPSTYARDIDEDHSLVEQGGAVLEQDFEGASLPSDWIVSSEWSFEERGNIRLSGQYISVMGTNNNMSDTVTHTLRAGPVNLDGASHFRLEFYHRFKRVGSSTIRVEARSQGESDWRPLGDWTGGILNTRFSKTVELDSTDYPSKQIEFRWWFGDKDIGSIWAIDDVKVTAIAPPGAPTNVTATANNGKIDITWVDNSPNEHYFRVERSEMPSFSSPVTVTTVLRNRTSHRGDVPPNCHQDYYYRVTAINYSSGDVSSIVSAPARLCAEHTQIREDFNSNGTNTPPNWNNPGELWTFGTNNTDASFDTAYAAFKGTGISGSLSTPDIDFSGVDKVIVRFKSVLNLPVGRASVLVSTDQGNSWQETYGLNRTSDNATEPLLVDISQWAAGNSLVRVLFRANMPAGGYWHIDDVDIIPGSVPDKPTDLTSVLYRGHYIYVTWSGNGDAYDLQWTNDNGVSWTTIANIPGSNTSHFINGEADRLYIFRVRAKNAVGASDYSNTTSIVAMNSARVFPVTISFRGSASNSFFQTNKDKFEEIIYNFADAVYEMTNGAHTIGDVTFLRPSYYSSPTTDRLLWQLSSSASSTQNCFDYHRPRRNKRGYWYGGNVVFCNGLNGRDFLSDNIDDYEAAGYLLAHYWADWQYGVWSEYTTWGELHDGQPQTIMNYPIRAADEEEFAWLNFSTNLYNNGSPSNEQYRLHGTSAWGTLLRKPSSDPYASRSRRQTPRPYYPELEYFSPGVNGAHFYELPGERHLSRANVDFNWWSGIVTNKTEQVGDPVEGVVYELVIDHSAHLLPEQLDNIKTSLKLFIDSINVGDRVGVMMYDDVPTHVQNPLTITGEADKEVIKAAIDTMTLSNAEPNIGMALQEALTVLDEDPPYTLEQVVFLLTSGNLLTGTHPISVLPAYEEANIPLYTFNFGVDAGVEATLETFIVQSGGLYQLVNRPASLQAAFNQVDKELTRLSPIYLKIGGTPTLTHTYSDTFYVDAALQGIDVGASYLDVLTSTTFALVDPNGQSYLFPTITYSGTIALSPECESWDNVEFSVETVCHFEVDDVASGEWQFYAYAGANAANLSYWIDGIPDPAADESEIYQASVTNLNGERIEYPRPVLIQATLTKGARLIAGASAVAKFIGPDDVGADFSLRDDGIYPDSVPDDGLYYGFLDYLISGEHYLSVSFSNPDNEAFLVATELEPEVLVNENFERLVESEVRVVGVLLDDHADGWGNLSNPATVLSVDNSTTYGRIDVAGDVDTFTVTVPADYEGPLVVRLTDLVFDMSPTVYLYGEDLSWYIEQSFPVVDDPGTDYVNIPFVVGDDHTITPGSRFVIQVTQSDPALNYGSYAISVGPFIHGDYDTSVIHRTYLPVIGLP